MASDVIRVTMLETAEMPEELVRRAEAAGGLLSAEGSLWLIYGEKTFTCEDTPEGREMLQTLSGEAREPETEEQALRMILSDRKRAEELVRRFRIPGGGPRCILALKCESRRGKNPAEDIRMVAPLEKEDLVVRYSQDLAVLIKQGEDPEEAAEYAMALVDTVEGETGLRLEAGVSNPRETPSEWSDAFREARSALGTGRVFSLPGPVYIYRKQALERLLQEIPAERRREIRRQVFGGEADRLLNGEMMETAEMFLRSDLNLSDTARQMFIHRNTLTYRLDKIRKETGLDLRKFNDAVIFRVLTALPGETEDKKLNER